MQQLYVYYIKDCFRITDDFGTLIYVYFFKLISSPSLRVDYQSL